MIKDFNLAFNHSIDILNQEVDKKYDTWLIPCSGGKDSAATRWMILIGIKEGLIKSPPKKIIFYMADTMLEYASFLKQAEKQLVQSKEFALEIGLDAQYFISRPRANDDFWVRILGYGLAPPTANMRWCVDKMKISNTKKTLKGQGWWGNPTFLGVRFGESIRRDKHLNSSLAKKKRDILSCKVGGECGPDTMYHKYLEWKVPTYAPVLEWSECAIWDFIRLQCPAYGFDISGLEEAYGPDGKMRYGCWACPLIYDDKTGYYLAKKEPNLYKLIKFADQNFRRGGEAWKMANREYFYKGDDLGSGRLSISYCKRLYSWMIDFEKDTGIQLFEYWQKAMIMGIWAYREQESNGNSPAGFEAQLKMDLGIEKDIKQLNI